ncbi:MAG TPA: hypothetical protein VHV78_03225, partial [Gemmatimonadaceae bacterium]|nr:hypothetical protein [Gemmatimonadaceae bacterium]
PREHSTRFPLHPIAVRAHPRRWRVRGPALEFAGCRQTAASDLALIREQEFGGRAEKTAADGIHVDGSLFVRS